MYVGKVVFMVEFLVGFVWVQFEELCIVVYVIGNEVWVVEFGGIVVFDGGEIFGFDVKLVLDVEQGQIYCGVFVVDLVV